MGYTEHILLHTAFFLRWVLALILFILSVFERQLRHQQACWCEDVPSPGWASRNTGEWLQGTSTLTKMLLAPCSTTSSHALAFTHSVLFRLYVKCGGGPTPELSPLLEVTGTAVTGVLHQRAAKGLDALHKQYGNIAYLPVPRQNITCMGAGGIPWDRDTSE